MPSLLFSASIPSELVTPALQARVTEFVEHLTVAGVADVHAGWGDENEGEPAEEEEPADSDLSRFVDPPTT